MSIIVSGHLFVEPERRDAYLAARLAIMAHAREAPGCGDFSLSADPLVPGRVNVYERWDTKEQLLAYRAGGGPELDDSVPTQGADVELHHISVSEAP